MLRNEILFIAKFVCDYSRKMRTRKQVEALRHAIKMGDTETLRAILLRDSEIVRHQIDIDHIISTPLFEALLNYKNEEIIKLLIDFGANVNERVFYGKVETFTFLQLLVYFPDCKVIKKVAQILIDNGADVNATYNDSTQQTALQMAIKRGNVEYTEFLLKNDARFVGGPEWDRTNPMNFVMEAPKTTQTQLLQSLIKHGMKIMDTRSQDIHKRDYLQVAIQTERVCPDKIDLVGIAKILLNSGLPVQYPDDNFSKLHLAAFLGNNDLISMLIDRGADINLRCQYDGQSPLFLAACKNNLYTVDFLLSKGADVNTKTSYGETALHIACEYKNLKMIELLVRNGAQISPGDSRRGFTPFSLLGLQKYKESNDLCVDFMVQEIAKLKFFEDIYVSEKDMNLIKVHPEIEKLYQSCREELSLLSSIKFYTCYSYSFVLNRSKTNVKKLANLTKNREFVQKFETNLILFPQYQNELRRIFHEAIQFRDRLLIVYSRLQSVFESIFPDVIINKLADSFTAEDLSQFN